MTRYSTTGYGMCLALVAGLILGQNMFAATAFAQHSTYLGQAKGTNGQKKGKAARIAILKKQEETAKEEAKANAEARAEARRKAQAEKKTPAKPETSDGEHASSDAPAASSTASTAREWSDSTGKFHINAELLGVKDGKVQLKKSDGKVITVPLAKLSSHDQDALQKTSQPTATK